MDAVSEKGDRATTFFFENYLLEWLDGQGGPGRQDDHFDQPR